jgi:hypothetical protein
MSENISTELRPLSPELLNAFQEFVQMHSPALVSRHLRCVLLDYIRARVNTGLPFDFEVYLEEFYDLFELLDEAQNERMRNELECP